MKNYHTILFLTIICLLSSLCCGNEARSSNEISLELFDKSRNRLIPVALYLPIQTDSHTKLPVVIMNHGYGAKNTQHSFLAHALTGIGYFVVSIQHDLPNDPPLARTGNIYERRMPLWKQGVENIHVVLKELKTKYTQGDFDNITLIGYSNGGDISMLLASNEPELVKNVISLDSLRMHFPRTASPRMLSLRASDTKADANVLPSTAEQQKYGIEIITLKGAKHNDMFDDGPASLKKDIIDLTIKFLQRA